MCSRGRENKTVFLIETSWIQRLYQNVVETYDKDGQNGRRLDREMQQSMVVHLLTIPKISILQHKAY